MSSPSPLSPLSRSDQFLEMLTTLPWGHIAVVALLAHVAAGLFPDDHWLGRWRRRQLAQAGWLLLGTLAGAWLTWDLFAPVDAVTSVGGVLTRLVDLGTAALQTLGLGYIGAQTLLVGIQLARHARRLLGART